MAHLAKDEIWINSSKFENYEVSSFGRVRHKHNKHVLKPSSDRYGYQKVSLGNVDNVQVHRLICESFYGEPGIQNAQVNHIDCNRQNNHVLNLEWCTPSENVRWGMTRGNIDPMIGLTKATEINHKPVRIVELDKTFGSVKECAYFLGVKPTNVSRCLTGSRKGQKLKGYTIEFVKKERLI